MLAQSAAQEVETEDGAGYGERKAENAKLLVF